MDQDYWLDDWTDERIGEMRAEAQAHIYHDSGRVTPETRVEREALADAQAGLGSFLGAAARRAEDDGWEFDDDGRPVRYVGPSLGGIEAALYALESANNPGTPVADRHAAEENFRVACLAVAARVVRVRVALLGAIRDAAQRIASVTATSIVLLTLRARRAVADLAGRLHGLIHACLVAARVSTARAATVASRTV